MASAVRPSIVERHGDGLPRFTRSDGHFRHDQHCDIVMASAVRLSIVEVRRDGLPRFTRSDGNFSA